MGTLERMLIYVFWLIELSAVLALLKRYQSSWLLIIEKSKMVKQPAMSDILGQIKSTPDLVAQPRDELGLAFYIRVQLLDSLS